MRGVYRVRGAGVAAVRNTALGVLALCTAINLISRGFGESFAVFLLPLSRDFPAERASLTGIYSVYMLAHGLSAPAVGTLFDRLGPRAVYCAGLAVFALAFLLASVADALWQVYVALGLLSGVAVAALGVTTSSALVSRWFRARLSRAMAVLYAALGIGMLLVAPASQALIDSVGWRMTYRVFAAFLFVVFAVLLFLPWRRIASGHPDYRVERNPARTQGSHWNLSRAFGVPSFWVLFGIYFVTAFSTFAITVQAVAYLVESGFSALEAASIFGTAGVMSIFGMLAAGLAAEHFRERHVAAVSYSCTILGIGALALLQWQPVYALAIAFILLFGAMQGSRGPLIATLTARLFAGAGVGSIYGGLTLAMGLGGAAGSWAVGVLHDLTGGYGAGFLAAALAAAAGIVLFGKEMEQK